MPTRVAPQPQQVLSREQASEIATLSLSVRDGVIWIRRGLAAPRQQAAEGARTRREAKAVPSLSCRVEG